MARHTISEGADEPRATERATRPGEWRIGSPHPLPLALRLASMHTSPTSPENLATERRITQIRWIGAALCAALAPFVASGTHLFALYLCLAVVAAYNLLFSRVVHGGRAPWLFAAYAYGLFDIVMATALIAATGGEDSPFFLAYFPLVVHAAIRFGRGVALGSSIVVGLGYGLVGMGIRATAHDSYGQFLLKVGFVALTAVFAGHLGDRARAAEVALARQLDRTRALHTAGSALTASLDPAAVATRLVAHGRALVGADIAILDLRDPAPGGGESGGRHTDVVPAAAYLAKLILQSGLPDRLAPPDGATITRHELARDAELLGVGGQAIPQAALLRAPILLGGRWAGDLLLLRPDAFEPNDADVVGAFANQASVTLENARLYQLAREQAATDPITGLPNHRALKERLAEEVARARQQAFALCVLMLDIDHFKNYNDAFGHAAGDGALRAVAGALQRSLRRGDYAARYGGEEFVLILPDTDLQAGSALAERLRTRVADLADDANAEEYLSAAITVSIGVAAFPEHGDGRDLLLYNADLAMYLAKHIGRNQVCLATDLGTARGLDALFAQVTGHLSLPNARWGPRVVDDLERRFTRLAALRSQPGAGAGGEEGYSVQTVETVTALAATLDAKDHYTEGHSRHVATLGVTLARAVGCSPGEIEAVRIGGLLHDIGKIGVPEALLNKSGGLTDDEWAIVRAHPDIGARILAPLGALQEILPLVRYHHERWDGNGYPLRMQGEAIPLGARILAICDAYDTMVSDRPYRRGIGRADALARLAAAAGTQFDPQLVHLFVALPLDDPSPIPKVSTR